MSDEKEVPAGWPFPEQEGEKSLDPTPEEANNCVACDLAPAEPEKLYSLRDLFQRGMMQTAGDRDVEDSEAETAVLADEFLKLGDLPLCIPTTLDLDKPMFRIRTMPKSRLESWAYKELERAGYFKEGPDDLNYWMGSAVMQMLTLFSLEGHSGASAPFAVSLFSRLASWKPLSPLTGEDDEWENMSDCSGYEVYQNKRYSSVFKEGDGKAHDIDAYVFVEPYTDPETGEVRESGFTGSASRKHITFPYIPPEKPVYIHVPRDSTHEEQLAAVAAYEAQQKGESNG